MKAQYLILLLATVIIASCNRKGCADPLADNYDPSVKKAQNKMCTYNEPTISPCGNQVQFCAKKDTLELQGPMQLESFAGSVVLTWEKSGADFHKLDLEIFGVEEGNFITSNSNTPNTFTASYVNSSGATQQVSGQMKIAKYNETSGITGSFSVKFDDGSEITEGFLYRVK